MRLILASALCALPAHAQDVASFGGTGCALMQINADTFEAHCFNAETFGNAWSEGAMTTGGVTVGLTVHHGPGDIPDTFTLFPPDGFVAMPPVLTLDEGTGGTAVVIPYVGF